MSDNRRAFIVSITCAALLVLAGTALLFSWLTRQALENSPRLTEAQANTIIGFSRLPALARTVTAELPSRLGIGPAHSPLMLETASVAGPSWQRHFPEAADPGYLLFSGLLPATGSAGVELIRIRDGKVLARWDPDWTAILARSSKLPIVKQFTEDSIHAVHPYLTDDGDVIFSTGASLVRMNACSPQPVWLLPRPFHHSVGQGSGHSVWTLSLGAGPHLDEAFFKARLRDDSITRVSTDGRIIDSRSFLDILIRNGMAGPALGSIGQHNLDPLHLNEVVEAATDSAFWQRGDLLVSSRHLSTVFLYRPTTDRIVWSRAGPWMNQHSVAFVGDHQISMLDNHVVRDAPPGESSFVARPGVNRVLLLDLQTGQVTEPYKRLLEAAAPRTITEGRAQVLADGGLFLEETNRGRLLRFTPERLLWSKVNDVDTGQIGALGWSRYLTQDEAAGPLEALRQAGCLAGGTT